MEIHMPKNKIPLFVGLDNFYSRPGGLGRAFDSICKEFEAKGNLFLRLEIGYPLYGSKVNPENSFAYRVYWLLRAAIRSRHSTSYIFSHFALHTFIISLINKAPIVSFFHGPWAFESEISEGKKSIKYHIRKIIEKRIYKKSKLIQCASESFREILISNFGISEDKIEVCPLGVDLHRFSIRNKKLARLKLELDDSATIYISVRRLTKRMGLEDLIRGFSDFCSKNSDGLLFIIGTGPEKKRYQDEIVRLKLEKRIMIIGEVSDEDLPLWYAASDLSIVPSRNLEGFGLVALESLASGVPVLASKCGGLEEIVEKWNNKFLFDVGNYMQISEKLNDFSIGVLKAEAHSCRKFAEEYSWQNSVCRIQDLLVRQRILFLSSEDVLSGAEISLATLVKNLSETFSKKIYIGGKGPLYKRFIDLGYEVEVIPELSLDASRYSSKIQIIKSLISLFKSFYFLNDKLRKSECEFVFINTFKTLVVSFPALLFSSKNIIYWAHDSFEFNGRFHVTKKIFFRFVLRVLKVNVVCNSLYTAETLRKYIGIESQYILYPLIEDISRFSSKSSDSILIIGICSRIAEWKGQLFALESLMPLLLSHRNLFLEILGSPIFGDEDYAKEVEDFIENNGLNFKVKMIPFCDDPYEIVSKWNLSIHSSILPEPFGRTVAESLKLGVPVIVPNSGGLLEIVEIGSNSLAYTMGDRQDLYEKVKLFLTDELVRKTLTSNSKLNVEKFQVSRQVENFENWLIGFTKV